MRLFQGILFGLLCVPLTAFAFSFPELFTVENTKVDISSTSFIAPEEIEQYESRIDAWQTLIEESQNDSDWQKINKANQFFNRISYSADNVQWGVEDYWASPREFLRNNAGDCEDYSIAKYFTLKAMGVSDDRLRITYVTSLPLNQAHMVLVYLDGGEKTPLVLDNLREKIEPFSLRKDLEPVYSFNNNGLWLAFRDVNKEELIGDTQQIGPWETLSLKVAEDQFL